MLLLTVIIFILMTAINFAIGRRVPVYPAFVFCCIWGIDLLLILMAGDFFFRMSDTTLILFSCGALVFSVGSALAFLVPLKDYQPEPIGQGRGRVLTVLFWIFVLLTPLAIRYIYNIASSYGTTNLLVAAGWLATDANEAGGGDPYFTLFGNFTTFGMYFGLIAFYEQKRGPKRAILSVLLALVLNLLTAGRSGFVDIAFGVLCIDWLRRRRIRWKLLIGMAAMFVVLVIGVAVAVGKGGAKSDASFADNAAPVTAGLVLYAAGGLVGFDRVLQEPGIIVHNWIPYRPLLLTANKFGANYELPPSNAEFMAIGPHGVLDNVYTFYFAYIDLGYIPMMVCVLSIGFFAGLFYRKAMQGHPPSAILYSIILASILTSVFGDPFYSGLIFSGRLWMVCWLFYSLPKLWARLKRFTSRSVDSDIALLAKTGRTHA